MEDAVKRLDELTEEARMAVAQNSNEMQADEESVRGATNTVIGANNSMNGGDDGVSGIDDPVASRVAHVDDQAKGINATAATVDDRGSVVGDKESVRGATNTIIGEGNSVDGRNDGISGVDDPVANRVAHVDDQAKGINTTAATADDRGMVVGDKVAEAIHGAQIIFSQAREVFNNLNRSDGKEAKDVIEQMASNIDQVKRSSFANLISTDYRAQRMVLENPIPRFFLAPDMTGQSASSNLQALFEAALRDYEKQTGISLAQHPLVDKLQNCDTVESITAVLHEQTQAFSDFRDKDKALKPLKSAVSVLCKLFSTASFGQAIGLVRP